MTTVATAAAAPPAPRHPAKFSSSIMAVLAELVEDEAGRRAVPAPDLRVLDPFAGTGRVHQLAGRTVGNEIEAEWAQMSANTVIGDGTALPFADRSFDVAVTSCTYGNRLADHHDAKDSSRRMSYTHTLGHQLRLNNTGAMAYREHQQTSAPYRVLHRAAWLEVWRVLADGGVFFLNVSDFFAQRERQHVTAWHCRTLQAAGFDLERLRWVETPRLRFGANRQRVEKECIVCLRKNVIAVSENQA